MLLSFTSQRLFQNLIFTENSVCLARNIFPNVSVLKSRALKPESSSGATPVVPRKLKGQNNVPPPHRETKRLFFYQLYRSRFCGAVLKWVKWRLLYGYTFHNILLESFFLPQTSQTLYPLPNYITKLQNVMGLHPSSLSPFLIKSKPSCASDSHYLILFVRPLLYGFTSLFSF